jgi:ABC-type lipoprotein release transport system permease subunit
VRLVTYLGLVVRRVWSKRGILIGSFLGSTLVIALLVVLPLYEASVQAIDLKFSLAGTIDADVDITSFTQTNGYTGAGAQQNREIVEENWQRFVVNWYPTALERSQTREFLVIPVDGSVDWLAQAAAWKETIAQRRLEGAPPEEDPPVPYPRPPPEATQMRILTAPDVEDRLTVVSGTWPGDLTTLPAAGPGAPLPIVLGSDVAAQIQREVGDVFVLRPFFGFPEVFELVEVAAIVEPVDPTDKFWGVDDPGRMAYLSQATFDAYLSPIVVNPNDDPWARSSRGYTDTTVTQRWFLEFDRESLELDQRQAVINGIVNYNAGVSQASNGVIASNSFLPLLLAEFQTRSTVIGAPINAMLALVVGGALYFLIYTAALTLEREGPEIALLRTRGASSSQTVGIHLAQSALIAVVAALLAPYVARLLVSITGRVPPLSMLTGGAALEVSQVRQIEPYLFIGAVLVFLAMGLAILPISRRSVLELRSLAARPTKQSVWQRYNLDLFAIALSLVIMFQLWQRGFINLSGGEATLDPLAVIFPVLLLFTGALVMLRLLPWLLRLAGWFMTKARFMSMSLPGWHLGRNPVPYGRLALLVWLTTGLGAFALTYANTLEQSFADRAAFAAGADVRVIDDNAGWLVVPEEDQGARVVRTDGAPRRIARRAEALAIRPDEFSEVVTWRSDFGADNPADVFGALRPDGSPPALGVGLPPDATASSVDGVVVPRSAAEEAALGERADDQSLRLMVKVFDAEGQVWTMQADTDFVDTGWGRVVVDLTEGLNTSYPQPPVAPLTLHTMWLERSDQTDGNIISDETLLFSDVVAITPGGTVSLDTALAELSPINGMTLRRDIPGDRAATIYYSELPPEMAPPSAAELAASPLLRPGTVSLVSLAGPRTRVNPLVPQLRRIPDDILVLLDAEAAGIAGLEVGESSSYSIGSEIIPGVMAGFVGEVPTMNDRTKEGNMIVDFDALNAWVNGPATWSFETNLARIEGPDELWVATENPDAAIRRITAQLDDEPEQIVTLTGAAAEFSSRPVQVGLVAILFVGAAVSVVLALAGVTGYVLLAVERRAREMGVLRALGFQRREVAGTFAVEQMAVIGLGAAVGVAGGIILTWIMIPFLQLGETATEIEPAVVLSVDWSTLWLYVAAVALMLIASVVWATRRVSARRMSEVLREVER